MITTHVLVLQLLNPDLSNSIIRAGMDDDLQITARAGMDDDLESDASAGVDDVV